MCSATHRAPGENTTLVYIARIELHLWGFATLHRELRARSFFEQGPQMKLMRWFSLDDCSEFWCPEIFTLKMVLEFAAESDPDDVDGGDDIGLQASTQFDTSPPLWPAGPYGPTDQWVLSDFTRLVKSESTPWSVGSYGLVGQSGGDVSNWVS